ncbi:MAG: S53 family peptidase [Terracidiphilus sp.]
MSNMKSIPIKGTEHTALPGTRPIGPTDPHQQIEVSVVLKHRQALPPAGDDAKHFSHGDFAKAHGADPAHVDKIRQFAHENNLQILESGDEVLRRTVTLSGTAGAMEKAFSVELTEFEHPDGTYRGHTSAIQMPEQYASFVSGVFGLDDRAVARPHIRYQSASGAFGARAQNTSYTPAQVAKLYGFPQDANGSGQKIGIIELGGGYRMADTREYVESLGLPPLCIKSVTVNHAHNRPSTSQSADSQVMLDIEVAGAVAPGASIVVYFAPNTAQGFQEAISTAVHDQLNKPSVLSIGWGNAEANWTHQSMENFHQVAHEAALLGITVIASCGDNGASDGMDDGKNHVDFPASCPHVLAVGGTRLTTANGSVESETVWNNGVQGGATGGGYSAAFGRPAWQASVVTESGRGVPDVAGNADPETGYSILVDGQQQVVGGTSAVAPLWAALVVLLNQKLNRRLGFINAALYRIDQSSGFREITLGNNGAYSATYGWNPCCGQGVPMGNQLLQALQGTVQVGAGHVQKERAPQAVAR